MHTCISSHGLKRSWRSCPRRVNAGNKNTPSTHHPRRWTTLMVGLKNSHICKNLTHTKKKKKNHLQQLTICTVQTYPASQCCWSKATHAVMTERYKTVSTAFHNSLQLSLFPSPAQDENTQSCISGEDFAHNLVFSGEDFAHNLIFSGEGFAHSCIQWGWLCTLSCIQLGWLCHTLLHSVVRTLHIILY